MEYAASRKYRRVRQTQKIRRHFSRISAQATHHRRYLHVACSSMEMLRKKNEREMMRVICRMRKGDVRLFVDTYFGTCMRKTLTPGVRCFLQKRLYGIQHGSDAQSIADEVEELHDYCKFKLGLDFTKLSEDALESIQRRRNHALMRMDQQRQRNKKHRDTHCTSRVLRNAENTANQRNKLRVVERNVDDL